MHQSNTHKLLLFLILVISVLIHFCLVESEAAEPLKVLPGNPRYFTDGSGKAIYLTGSHTWPCFQDIGFSDPPPKFDYDAYLSFLKRNNHNFFRLWVWEQAKWHAISSRHIWNSPMPFKRVGPGKALDGKNRFDLSQFDETYFNRLRQRVVEAHHRGIYVAIMLFNGWSIEKKGWGGRNPWEGHPFNRHNNINGIDGDLNGDGEGKELHSLKIAETLRIQKLYVKKIIDSVNDLPNVLWEISNESSSSLESIAWQYHMINYIKLYEKEKPHKHPVGMTGAFGDGWKNSYLYNSQADWISPLLSDIETYKENPPVSAGKKVILSDTDHLWGVGGNVEWVWKSFMRGLNPIFMDAYFPYNDWIREMGVDVHFSTNSPVVSKIRKNLGYTLNYAKKVDLTNMYPHPELSSSKYCLASANGEYLIYIPRGNQVAISLKNGPSKNNVEWFNPDSGRKILFENIEHKKTISLNAPFGGFSVVHIYPSD